MGILKYQDTTPTATNITTLGGSADGTGLVTSISNNSFLEWNNVASPSAQLATIGVSAKTFSPDNVPHPNDLEVVVNGVSVGFLNDFQNNQFLTKTLQANLLAGNNTIRINWVNGYNSAVIDYLEVTTTDQVVVTPPPTPTPILPSAGTAEVLIRVPNGTVLSGLLPGTVLQGRTLAIGDKVFCNSATSGVYTITATGAVLSEIPAQINVLFGEFGGTNFSYMVGLTAYQPIVVVVSPPETTPTVTTTVPTEVNNKDKNLLIANILLRNNALNNYGVSFQLQDQTDYNLTDIQKLQITLVELENICQLNGLLVQTITQFEI